MTGILGMTVLKFCGAKSFGEEEAPQGTWIRWIHMVDQLTAAFRCPKCGRAFCLANHRIAEDGRVSPSVVCPHQCGFHVMMVLEGWPGD